MAGGSSCCRYVPDLPIFDGKDHFDEWQLKMKTFFISQGLWHNVTKNEIYLSSNMNAQQQLEEERKDAHALYCIQQALAPTIFSKINNPALSAKDAWDILDVKYNQKHGFIADDDFTAAKILIMTDEDISLPFLSIRVISNNIRELNPEAYTPKVISIGPLHHRRPHLVNMEKHKLDYAKSFLKRTNKPKAFFVKFIQLNEMKIPYFYSSEPCELDSRSYVEMILLDSFFILELIVRLPTFLQSFVGRSEWADPGLLKKIKVDLLMFENQLPFLLLSKLYDFSGQNKDLRMDCRHFFLGDLFGIQPWHYIHNDTDEDPLHFIDFIQSNLNSRRDDMPLPSIKPYLKNAAKNLSNSRVKFQLTKSQWLNDICFKKRSLHLPRLVVDNMTERLFRNIMVVNKDVLVMRNDTLIYSYLWFLHLLMQSDDDVSVLVEANVIENRLDNNQAVVELFNNLCGNINTFDDFYFWKICKDLDDYVMSWEGWYNNRKRILKDVYFSNLWTSTGTIAAIILLVLTLVQAITSILQVVRV